MIHSHSAVSLFILLAFVKPSLEQKQCYSPNGEVAKNDIPCTFQATGLDVVLPCCGFDEDCLPDGTCGSSTHDDTKHRGTCTDPTWNSDNCPQFCLQSTGLLHCGLDYYCCSDGDPQCCNDNSTLFLIDTWNYTASAARSLATFTSTSSSTVSSASSPPSTITVIDWGTWMSTLTTSTVSNSPTTPTTSTSQLVFGSPSTSSMLSSPSTTSASPLPSNPSIPTPSSPLTSIHTKVNPVVVTTESKSDTSTTGTSTVTISASTTTAAVAAVHSEAKRDWTGVGIGVGIGVAVPLLALAIIGPLLWRRHRRKPSHGIISPVMYPYDGASSRSTSTRSRMDKPAPFYEAGGAPTYELDAVGERAELPMKSPKELPGAEGERQRYVAYRPPS